MTWHEIMGVLMIAAIGMILGIVAGYSWAAEDAGPPTPQPALLVEIVELPGDRFVECVRPLSGRGVTCNWEAADAD